MTHLTLEQILEVHALVVGATGGSSGLRDLGRLDAAIAVQTQNVFGEELYPGIVDKTAAMARGIIADHPFVDGNKRTAMLAGITLLALNNLNFTAHSGDIEEFAVNIATRHIDVPQISAWFKSHIV
jgi:death-on-curing protein